MTLIKDPINFLDAVKRMTSDNIVIQFPNVDDSFVIMLRQLFDDDDASHTIEVVIVYDEDKDPSESFYSLLEMDGMGFFDEEDESSYIIDRFQFPTTPSSDDDDLLDAVSRINEVYAMRKCPCNKYLIKDSGPICLYCHMTATPDDMLSHLCPICHDDGPRIAMATQSCCGQLMHSACLQRWFDKQKCETCPMCRHQATSPPQPETRTVTAPSSPLAAVIVVVEEESRMGG